MTVHWGVQSVLGSLTLPRPTSDHPQKKDITHKQNVLRGDHEQEEEEVDHGNEPGQHALQADAQARWKELVEYANGRGAFQLPNGFNQSGKEILPSRHKRQKKEQSCPVTTFPAKNTQMYSTLLRTNK
jgi:hypothetical protein